MNFSLVPFISAESNKNNIYYFKKDFGLRDKLLSAQIKICGLGFFNAFINKQKIGNYFFIPSFTDYVPRYNADKTGERYSFYYSFDITNLINSGKNCLEIYVGGGYFENTDREDLKKYSDVPDWYFGKKRLKYSLTLNYENGTEYLCSDEDTLSCDTGNRSNLFSGDYIDFTVPLPKLKKSQIVEESINLKPASIGGSVASTVMPADEKRSEKQVLFDFSVNHTGGVLCEVKGQRGAVLTVKYGEFLNKDGTLNLLSSAYDTEDENGNIIKNPQINTYILSGEYDKIEPLFSWNCYRYAEFSCESDFKIKNCVSLFIHQECKKTGKFECDNRIIQKIYDAYIQTQLCNLQCGVPTDCPHREKMPYTGDGWLTQKSAMYSFDLIDFYSKWLYDIINSQQRNGQIPNTAPFMGCGGGYFWGYAVCEVPLNLYYFTSDKKYLQKSYCAVEKWVKYLSSLHKGDYILTENKNRWLLSDWLAPEVMEADVTYFGTVCFFKSVNCFIKINEILYGKCEESLYLLAENIKNAINETFLNKETYSYSKDVQGETALAVHTGIVPEEIYERVIGNIKKHYAETGHFDTGIIMTPILLDVLSENGMDDIAYNLLTADGYPSYSYMLENETTIPEHWSKKWIPFELSENGESSKLDGDVSHCHPMFGSVVSWFYEKIAGFDTIDILNKKIKISPKFIDKILQVNSSIELENKKVSVCYNSSKGFEMSINIPDDYTAEITLPEFIKDTVFDGNRLRQNTFEITGGNHKISGYIN